MTATKKAMAHTMVDTGDAAILDFIYLTTIIEPLSDIISKLEKREYRDCDISWLNKKLHKYIMTALCTIEGETEGKKRFQNIKDDEGIIREGSLNDNNRERFLSEFRLLLEYFKSIR